MFRFFSLLALCIPLLCFLGCGEASAYADTEIMDTVCVSDTAAAEESETQAGTEFITEKVAEAVQPVALYTDIPLIWNKPAAEVRKLFEQAGIEYTEETGYSAYAADKVYKFEYYGYTDSTTHHMRVGKPVKLFVSLGAEPSQIHPVQNYVSDDVIYLTFDDGPSKNVDELLAILEKHNVKATFFLVGDFITWRKDDVKKIYDAGHKIGCHTMTHDIKTIYSDKNIFADEIAKWYDALEGSVGTRELGYKLFRFPGGSTATRLTDDMYATLSEYLCSMGFNCFDWTLANNDKYPAGKKNGQSADDYLKNSLISTLANCEQRAGVPKVVLMHDTEDDTVAMVDWTITYLTERGYTFGTLDTLNGSVMFKY